MEHVDCVIIGAGVIGLAIARALVAKSGKEILVLEREHCVGSQVSARNSEVMHAGIYYPPGSLKARLCVRGQCLLYAYLSERGIAYKCLGKLILAQDAVEHQQLQQLQLQAMANGVTGLELLTKTQVVSMEPELSCYSALYSPSSGILDSHSYLQALQADMQAEGCMLAVNSPLESATVTSNGFELNVGGNEPISISCKILINAAGLGAQRVSHSINGLLASTIPALYMARGNYFTLTGAPPFVHLVYPLPSNAGLGIHFTLDMNNRGKFGPDVEWIEHYDPTVNEQRRDLFYSNIARYYPGIMQRQLEPDYAGIRPKLVSSGSAPADFIIQDERHHYCPGYFACYGIESPGLTASLAIADNVVARITNGVNSN